jgi:hypothetical protein
MINENSTWITLIKGLTDATKNDRLQWSEKDNRSHSSFQSAIANAFAGSHSKVFSAQTESTAYELSSADFLAKAPFQLEVWQMQGLRQTPLGSVRSSANPFADGIVLNNALETLFQVVDETTESGEEIVSRLLDEL